MEWLRRIWTILRLCRGWKLSRSSGVWTKSEVACKVARCWLAKVASTEVIRYMLTEVSRYGLTEVSRYGLTEVSRYGLTEFSSTEVIRYMLTEVARYILTEVARYGLTEVSRYGLLASDCLIDKRHDIVELGQKMLCVATNIDIRGCTELKEDRLEVFVLISDPFSKESVLCFVKGSHFCVWS